MVKLLMMCACEKVIFADDKTVSLVSLIEEYTVTIPEGAPKPPADAVSPIMWTVFAFWIRDNADAHEQFEQHFALVAPDGQQLISGVMPFEVQSGVKKMRTTQPVFGMPISREGALDVVMSLRTAGSDNWQEVSRYPLFIRYAAAG